MRNVTAEQARKICDTNMQIGKEETIKLQLKIFETLLQHYIYDFHASHYFYSFKLDTTRRFLPEVIQIIQERGFEIKEYIVQYGDPHDWYHYYPVGSRGCTYGDFKGYKFSF